jgi:hypothetical protein
LGPQGEVRKLGAWVIVKDGSVIKLFKEQYDGDSLEMMLVGFSNWESEVTSFIRWYESTHGDSSQVDPEFHPQSYLAALLS